jgi:hypothetical protein
VKARLMMSARKPRFGNPLVSGAGNLDILGALLETSTVADAPSPRAVVDVEAGRIAFENTAVLWGDAVFSLRTLWANSVHWADPSEYLAPLLQTKGEIWPPGENAGQGELWPDSEMWPEGEMWPDSTVWVPALLAPEETGPVATQALSAGFQDP